MTNAGTAEEKLKVAFRQRFSTEKKEILEKSGSWVPKGPTSEIKDVKFHSVSREI